MTQNDLIRMNEISSKANLNRKVVADLKSKLEMLDIGSMIQIDQAGNLVVRKTAGDSLVQFKFDRATYDEMIKVIRRAFDKQLTQLDKEFADLEYSTEG